MDTEKGTLVFVRIENQEILGVIKEQTKLEDDSILYTVVYTMYNKIKENYLTKVTPLNVNAFTYTIYVKLIILLDRILHANDPYED